VVLCTQTANDRSMRLAAVEPDQGDEDLPELVRPLTVTVLGVPARRCPARGLRAERAHPAVSPAGLTGGQHRLLIRAFRCEAALDELPIALEPIGKVPPSDSAGQGSCWASRPTGD
jgi:hypothetical protein